MQFANFSAKCVQTKLTTQNASADPVQCGIVSGVLVVPPSQAMSRPTKFPNDNAPMTKLPAYIMVVIMCKHQNYS